MVDVAAALIWRGDRFLICQRPVHKARGLLWEFVGGKVEPGETKAEALVRECREELGITVSPGDVFMELTHEYPDLTVRLTLFNAEAFGAQRHGVDHRGRDTEVRLLPRGRGDTETPHGGKGIKKTRDRRPGSSFHCQRLSVRLGILLT